MPAIQLSRLKLQSAQLAEKFNQPAVFVRELNDILNFYADRAHRPGQSGRPHPLLPAYNTPAPVLRQVIMDLAQIVVQDPLSALNLADALWTQPYWECRLLATNLIGTAPVEPPDLILDRLQEWAETEPEDQVVEILLNQGFARIRKEGQESFLKLVEGWLKSAKLRQQQLGLRALLPLVADASFENLPVAFRLLTPYVRSVAPLLRPDLLAVLYKLAQRSPQETAYFFRQNLGIPDNPDTPWVTRQVLKEFPRDIQAALRLALQKK